MYEIISVKLKSEDMKTEIVDQNLIKLLKLRKRIVCTFDRA